MLGRAGYYFQKRVHRLAGDDTLEAAKSFAGKLRSHINFVSYTKLVIDIELWERSLPAKRPSRSQKNFAKQTDTSRFRAPPAHAHQGRTPC